MPKEINGLNKARAISAIVYSTIGGVAFLITLLFFFFNLRAGLNTLETKFKEHEAEEKQKMACFVQTKEWEIELRTLNTTLSEIKNGLINCQEEDKKFKEKIFELMLEIKDGR